MFPLCSDLGLPARLEGEYRHSMPQAKQREHIGRALEHLTLAKKHPSHEARSRGWRAFVEEAMVMPIAIDVKNWASDLVGRYLVFKWNEGGHDWERR